MKLDRILSLDDFQAAAKRYLPRPVFAYVAESVEDNQSFDDNRRAFGELAFVPRALVPVSAASTRTSLFGTEYSAPFGIAPMGISALSAYRGDLVQARAAAACGIPMIMSGSSLIRLEEVCAACPGTWFQAYLPSDWERIRALVERVARAGFGTLVVTVDVAVLSNREKMTRAGFSTPLRPTLRLMWDGLSHPRWTFGSFLRTIVQHGMPHFENNYAERGAPILAKSVVRDLTDRSDVDWNHLQRIRDLWKGRLVLKGILAPADARLAREAGCDGVIVSNHGGRQLDGAVAPLRVLGGVIAEAGPMTVMMDSGIRRGTDVLKALALGAKFVWVGRPFNFAASLAGEAGVRHAHGLLQSELQRDMQLLGITRLNQVSPDYLLRIGGVKAPGAAV